jgi:uncharacterized linocin/CFP29 family protein
MSDSGISLTDQQWQQIQQTVHDEAHKARVAARFLPLYGPLPLDAETVPAQELKPEDHDGHWRLHIDESATLRITTIAVNVYLNSQQIAQPDLMSALTLFRRAANIIARVEDSMIFQGAEGKSMVNPPVYKVTGGTPERGLLVPPVGPPIKNGQELVTAVARGIAMLEDQGYLAPYALALGDDLFVTAETPDKDSLVLPSDRIRPLIEGPLVRTGTLPSQAGVLVSLPSLLVEIVVATDIGVRFLQVTPEPKYVFRVSERFVLRIKDPGAILPIPTPPPAKSKPAR